MTTTNDALREALKRIKYHAVSLADAQVIAMEALDASNPDSQRRVDTNEGGFVSEEVQLFVIQVEKLLCEKLGRKWSATGISINTLVDELGRRASSKTEPQAQAGEPEVVAWVTVEDVRDFGKGPGESVFCFTKHGRWNVPLITLQSHREAMEREGWSHLSTVQAYRKELAKKDAALQACVEAGKSVKEANETLMSCERPSAAFALNEARLVRMIGNLTAAITQAKESME